MTQVDNRTATLKMVRTRYVDTLVLRNRRGYFIFANPTSAYVGVKKGVHKAMTTAGRSWMRDHERDAPSPLDVDTDIIISEEFDRFLGTVIIKLVNRTAPLKVVRIRGVGTLVLNNRRGYFTFVNPTSAYVGCQKRRARSNYGKRR